MRVFRHRRTWVKGAPFLVAALLVSIGCGCGSRDPEAGTLGGSPLDRLPPEITQLTDFGLRADWSPDGRRILFLDALAGDVWAYELGTKSLQKLTAHFEHAGFSRVHHLSNGDLILCGPVERESESDDPEEGRFDGVLWVLPRPFDGVPVPLGEPCWEGIAAARHRLRIAWARSSIDYTAWDFALQALFGPSELWIGDLEYEDGTPILVNRRRVLERRDLSRLCVLEAQDFRPPAEDELLFTAFNYRGGEVMGVQLETGELRAYSKSPWFDEADGVFPDGRSTLVTRELARVFIPHDLDLWRLTLDGEASWRRLTSFNRYDGYGVSNSAASPNGRYVVFQLRRSDSPPGNGLGLMLLDLEARSTSPHPRAGRAGVSTTANRSAAPEMSETIEAAGAVKGGAVQRAYLEGQYPPELDVLLAVMITDLAGRLDISESSIRVLAVEEVKWSDASLGCPQPGMSYAQVVTDGMRVILEARDTFYDYRGGGTGDSFLCVRAPVTEKSTAGLYELTEDGVVQLEPPKFDYKVPAQGNSLPDE